MSGRNKHDRRLAARRRDEDRRVVATQTAYSGPLPPPALLERYEQVAPGAATRILRQWEVQTEHRQNLENRVVDSNIANARRGQVFGLVIGLAVLVIAGWLLGHDKNGTALAMIIAELVGLVAVFIVGRRRQQRELAEKRAPIEQAQRTIHYE